MASLTYAQLYADLVAAAQTRQEPPEGTFTVTEFARDSGRSVSGTAARLLELVNAGVLEREKYGHKYYYWFVAGQDAG